MRHSLITLQSIVWLGILFCTAHVSMAGAQWQYRGFTVSGSAENLDESMKQAVADQIDIVCAVGFSPEFMTFFRAVPLSIVPARGILSKNPGLYLRSDRAVRLTPTMRSVGNKPVLLHELLHAYHDQRIADGFRNREILTLYESARQKDLFASRTHMMQNATEYFACAGTTFLFGVTAQEPYQRKHLDQQPALVGLLQKLFGPTCGAYEGTLSNVTSAAAPEPKRADHPKPAATAVP